MAFKLAKEAIVVVVVVYCFFSFHKVTHEKNKSLHSERNKEHRITKLNNFFLNDYI